MSTSAGKSKYCREGGLIFKGLVIGESEGLPVCVEDVFTDSGCWMTKYEGGEN